MLMSVKRYRKTSHSKCKNKPKGIQLFIRKQYELPWGSRIMEMETALQICKPYPQLNPMADFIFFLRNTLYVLRFLNTSRCEVFLFHLLSFRFNQINNSPNRIHLPTLRHSVNIFLTVIIHFLHRSKKRLCCQMLLLQYIRKSLLLK